jgi:hypothetical protein
VEVIAVYGRTCIHPRETEPLHTGALSAIAGMWKKATHNRIEFETNGETEVQHSSSDAGVSKLTLLC